MTVLVKVMLKGGVLDPQGKAIADALHRLGYTSVADVRAGKLFRIEVDTADPGHARDENDEADQHETLCPGQACEKRFDL